MKKYLITTFLVLGSIILPSGNAYAASARLTLNYQSRTFSISQEQVIEWQNAQAVESSKTLVLAPVDFTFSMLGFAGQAPPQINSTKYYNFSLGLIYDYLKSITPEINKPVEEPILEIKDNIVQKFVPPQDGLVVDLYKTSLDTLTALQVGRKNIEITLNQTLPKNSLSQTNNLGINELIAHGVSNFSGSPKNRRHNIAVGLEKFKGVIIKQGEEFSFNKNLGPVEKEQGFLPELVIKGDKGTIPELGGGLCQVSSTTFRAAMEAGLPITQRRNHAYAVQYYSPQGTDATIYPGVVDLKFINDTPGAILIWPYKQDNNTLVFDFYGTNDGRKVTLEKPIQYDRKTDGSMKATWTRHVTGADGKEISDVFKSDYKPPALFHHTEEFVKAEVDPVKGLQMPKN